MMKTCSKCKERKPTSKFHKDKKSLDGLSSACGECRNRSRNRKGDKLPKDAFMDDLKKVVKPVAKPATPTKRPHKAPPLVFAPKKPKPPVVVPTPKKVENPEELREAKRMALVRLVRNHRAEYETLIHRAKIQLKLPEKIK